MALEIEATQRIYKEIKDPLHRVFIIKRFIQNKPVKEIIKDFGWSKSLFYKTFEKYFSSVDKKDENGQKKLVKM
jgi:ACT domain-containing protein